MKKKSSSYNNNPSLVTELTSQDFKIICSTEDLAITCKEASKFLFECFLNKKISKYFKINNKEKEFFISFYNNYLIKTTQKNNKKLLIFGDISNTIKLFNKECKKEFGNSSFIFFDKKRVNNLHLLLITKYNNINFKKIRLDAYFLIGNNNYEMKNIYKIIELPNKTIETNL